MTVPYTADDPLEDGATAWRDCPTKHYFFKVWRDGDDYYFQAVSPLVGGGYRFHATRQIADGLEAEFFADHPARDRPSGIDADDTYTEWTADS